MRNATAYNSINDSKNIETRDIKRRDSRPLGMREVASLFEKLMFRPGKWVSLAGQSAGATRWGHGAKRVYGSVHCYDDAKVLLRKLKEEVERAESGFVIESREGPGTIEVRMNFLSQIVEKDDNGRVISRRNW